MVPINNSGGLQPASPPRQPPNPIGLGAAAITGALAVFKTMQTVTTPHPSYRGTYLQQALALWLVTGIVIAISVRIGRNVFSSGSGRGDAGESTYSGNRNSRDYSPSNWRQKEVKDFTPPGSGNQPSVQRMREVPNPNSTNTGSKKTPDFSPPPTSNANQPSNNQIPGASMNNNFPIGSNPFTTPKTNDFKPPVQQTNPPFGSTPASVAQTPTGQPPVQKITQVAPPQTSHTPVPNFGGGQSASTQPTEQKMKQVPPPGQPLPKKWE